jgi:eukaryotic-like serine/threonine-protein kinase
MGDSPARDTLAEGPHDTLSGADTMVPDTEYVPRTGERASGSDEAPTRRASDGSGGGQGAVDVAMGEAVLEVASFEQRYLPRKTLGEGGMGEVKLVHDARIGRDIAAKFMRTTHLGRADLRSRFEREARIQGQLEHPAVVPVYDLGLSPSGAPFFTMKRVRGRTIEEILEGLRKGEASTQAAYGRRKLLQALSQVCLAVEYAHERGVLHRDLKPENVMLGDYGEVYVLDWGIAKIHGDTTTGEGSAVDGDDAPHSSQGALLPAPGPKTAVGAISGTVGYMAPEQVRGETVDRRADVFALGVIAFEMITGMSFVPQGSLQEMLARSAVGVEGRPSLRLGAAAAVPPQLDDLCATATAIEPAARFPTARALHESLERYLDGDRDLLARKQQADAHAVAAQAAFAQANLDPAAREAAIREVSQALTLDPLHPEAREVMVRLLLEPPEDLPDAAEEELQSQYDAVQARSLRIGIIIYPMWLLLVPAIVHAGLRDPLPLGIFAFFTVATTAAVWHVYRRRRASPAYGLVILALSSVALAALTMLFGPLALVPGWSAANGTIYLLHLKKLHHRVAAGAMTLGAVLVPLLLELGGVLPPSFVFEDGRLVLLPRLMSFATGPTMLVFVSLALLQVIVPAMLAGRTGVEARKAERVAFLQSWNLRRFLPASARDVVATTRPEPPPDCAVLPQQR